MCKSQNFIRGLKIEGNTALARGLAVTKLVEEERSAKLKEAVIYRETRKFHTALLVDLIQEVWPHRRTSEGIL